MIVNILIRFNTLISYRLLVICVLTCLYNFTFCQIQQIPDKPENIPVKTEIFWLDLCAPSELHTITKSSGRNRLEVNWKNVLSFGLINTNQFKYDYKINSVPFASFVDTSYANYATTVKSTIDLSPDPFFIFEVASKSPNKILYTKLNSARDSINNELSIRLTKLNKIFSDFNFSYGDQIPTALRNDVTKYSEYIQNRTEYDESYWAKEEVEASLNKIVSLKYQQVGLSAIVNKLIIIEEKLFDNTFGSLVQELKLSINQLPSDFYINKGDGLGSESKSEENINSHYRLLETYQQSAQVIRTYYGRFEMEYEKIKNHLLSNDCKILTHEYISNIDEIILNFQNTKEAFYSLQNLYTQNPLENRYLEDYLIAIDRYGEFLSNRFMSLQKITRMNALYISPMSSNMKNFDLITFELEKTNKLTNHLERYSYDIYIKGGLKVDFSAGIFGTTLKNASYFTIDSLDSDFAATHMKMIKREEDGNMNIGFGGMVNITKRTGASWLAPGFSFGLILSTLPSLQFVSGVTLSIGKTERLLIHSGYAFGFVERLDELPLNEYIPTIRIGNNIHTIDKFMVKPFFGLSYNLSKNNVFMANSFSTSPE